VAAINKFDHYSVEDFVWDEQFRNWVLSPDPYLAEFWTNWLRQHPEKEGIVQQAAVVVRSLTVSTEKLSTSRKEEIIAATLEGLDNPISDEAALVAAPSKLPVHKRRYIRYTLGIAALFLLAIAGTWLIAKNTPESGSTDHTYNTLVKQSRTALVETINTSSLPLSVMLSDGSKVRLDSGARISYAPSFSNTDKREVYLSGGALFEIAGSPLKPFLVHANGIITKVLGTSFKVKTDLLRMGVTVEVITGRVAVYEQPLPKEHPDTRKGNGVILTPNQKVMYSGETNLFQTSLVDEPVPIEKANKKIVKEDFVFEDAPLSRVIEAIENLYGIKVEVEDAAILAIPFTGDISEQNLYRKFDAICGSTNTTYEVMETKVLIKGKGSN
jgi:ferric-dicitrate binding protein FerR (iron transport regulator)